MSRRHADNWSHPGHYLVDPCTWPWSPNGHGHDHEWLTATPFVQCQSALRFWDRAISKFDHENPWSRSCVMTFKIQRSRLWSTSNPLVTCEAWTSIDMFAFRFVAIGPFLGETWQILYLTLKIRGQGHGQGHTRWSHLSPSVQSICLLFVSWQSHHFWLRYSKFHIWPWKFKVKVMAKVKPDGHIWALEFNQYVCFLFRGNRTIFGWDIANSIFDLEKSRSRSWSRSNPMVTFEP